MAVTEGSPNSSPFRQLATPNHHADSGTVTTKLTRSHVAAQRAVSELIDQRTALRIGQQLVQAVNDEFAGVDR
ncbi:MAG: hypothetical protein SGJ19_19000 [Planctomycetia bacterium]|nr:hypothetical protein [Planctomycetia bacterium]